MAIVVIVINIIVQLRLLPLVVAGFVPHKHSDSNQAEGDTVC